MNDTTDTIAAIATAAGEAGISIVRISGPQSLVIADRIFRGRRKPSEVSGGRFLHGFIRAAADSGEEEVDEVVVLIYRAPHSYTCEDVVEIQGHGGRVAAHRVLRVVLAAGARLADPGEFTRRAFMNGRIDLLQAEAVADLVQAQSERSARSAFEQLQGRLSALVSSMYDDGIGLAADIEASLDFSEDELPRSTWESMGARFDGIIARLKALLDTWDEGHLLRDGALIAIAGRPNVGKSTLLNALLGKPRAIVTELPGTTRDTIEESLVVGGISVRLVDTAGLREAQCRIEREGIRRAEASAKDADIILYMVDASAPALAEDQTRVREFGADRCIVILNKVDLGQSATEQDFKGSESVGSSLIRGEGLDAIRECVSRRLEKHVQGPPHAVISERHRILLTDAMDRMTEARKLVCGGRQDMVVPGATLTREAVELMGRIHGRVYYNDLLDNVFHKFCIGK